MDEARDCCVKTIFIEDIHCGEDIYDVEDDDDEESDFDEITLDRLENIDVGKLPLLPEHISLKQLVDEIRVRKVVSETQTEINNICASIQEPFLEIFLAKQMEKFQCLIPDDIKDNCTNTQLWTSILSNYHSYILSDDYVSSIPLLYEYYTVLSENHKYVASKLVLNFLKALIHKYAEEVRSSVDPTNPNPIKRGNISESGEAKIRYVGGMCIARTKKHYINIIKYNLGNPHKHAMEKIRNCKIQSDLIKSMEAAIDQIDVNDNSFEEIERHQNATRCLTYINDNCFDFFYKTAW